MRRYCVRIWLNSLGQKVTRNEPLLSRSDGVDGAVREVVARAGEPPPGELVVAADVGAERLAVVETGSSRRLQKSSVRPMKRL